MSKQQYVLGLAFNKTLTEILLIEKRRAPEKCQKMVGKLNGIGGKVEKSDFTPADAMERECKEETGLVDLEWVWFAALKMKYGDMFCFYTATDDIYNYVQKEDEILYIHAIEGDPEWSEKVSYKGFDRMPNLDWLIPMALNHYLRLDTAWGFTIKEEYND